MKRSVQHVLRYAQSFSRHSMHVLEPLGKTKGVGRSYVSYSPCQHLKVFMCSDIL